MTMNRKEKRLELQAQYERNLSRVNPTRKLPEDSDKAILRRWHVQKGLRLLSQVNH